MVTTTFRNRIKTNVSAVASSGLGAFTISTAVSGYRSFSATDSGLIFNITIAEGVNWEVRTGCVYTHTTKSLSRGTLEDSSSGASVVFTSACRIVVTPAASNYNQYDIAAQTFSSLGQAGQVLVSAGIGAIPIWLSQPFDIYAFYPGIPTASAILLRIPIPRTLMFTANFAGSYGKASASATASTAFDITKNGTTIGTATFALGATAATFTTVSGAAQTLAAGDMLAIVAPATPDTTLADVGFVLSGTR